MKRRQIFEEIGFAEALWTSFDKLCDHIENAEGCKGSVYKTQKMAELRAAHIPPGVNGSRAVQVFARIKPTNGGIAIIRPRRFCKGKAESECRVFLGSDGSGWDAASSALLQWRLDPMEPQKAPKMVEFGDGHALPGGLPETNHSKF